MPKLQGKGLSDLYPKPKTYDQLKAEREEVQLARRPRFVAPKIALWSTAGMFTVLAAYGLITLIINDHLSSAGAVISGTFFSFLVCLAGMAAIFYVYTLINSVISRTLISSTALYSALLIILVINGVLIQLLAQNRLNIFLAMFSALLFNFVVAYFAVRFLLKRG
jgi:hypothetical protein